MEAAALGVPLVQVRAAVAAYGRGAGKGKGKRRVVGAFHAPPGRRRTALVAALPEPLQPLSPAQDGAVALASTEVRRLEFETIVRCDFEINTGYLRCCRLMVGRRSMGMWLPQKSRLPLVVSLLCLDNGVTVEMVKTENLWWRWIL
jgi:hypothetical protein